MGLEIFISYSSIDLNTIETIIKPLKEQEGVNIFCAEYSLNPGQKISNTIIQKISNSDLFMLFHSANASDSSYVQQEIGIAKANNKTIIPILLDSTSLDGMLEDINYINLSDPDKRDQEMSRFYHYISAKKQSKKKTQLLGVLGFLAIGIMILSEK
ncbi:MAG TPA: hypothetical protein DDW90_10685 [Cyanobacteria bacterium UBA9971]|nr:hypothetical protein [Cyanobacteria bacterium UBA9971]